MNAIKDPAKIARIYRLRTSTNQRVGVDAEDDTLTTIRLRVPEDERSHLIFMLNNETTVNIVKIKVLDGSLTIGTSKALKICGISRQNRYELSEL